MSVNSSSSSSLPSNSSTIFDFMKNCFDTSAGTFSTTAFTVILILTVLPLCVYVIYLGFQRWRQQRSGTTMSHSDVFTFHMVAMELMSVVGSIVNCCGVLTHLPKMMMVGMCLFAVNISGQQLYHTLTCVERYLAVVHPVTYLGLKKGKGIRIRNISIGCVWLLVFVNIGLVFIHDNTFINIFSYCTSAIIFTVICFCSLSVLYVLIRPGPGAGGEGRPRVDQSKMRAFYISMAILGALSIRVGATVVIYPLFNSPQLVFFEKCRVWLSIHWFTLPSRLVLPLLFIHRAGKLMCCKNSNQSGHASD